MKIPFTKMHGLGNDFILIDCRRKEFGVLSPAFAKLSRKLCHRRFGIGADQMLLLYPSDVADFKMKIFNADGGEVEMCGNGIRCLAKYIWDRRLSKKDILNIETLAGIIKPERAGEQVRVDMGEPIFEPERIPVNIKSSPPIIDYPLRIKDREFKITCVSMGNPHAVIFLDEDISKFPVHVYGPEIENHLLFPRRTNVEFVNVINKNKAVMRVWERGSGETPACGTGASATGVASILKGLTGRKITVQLPGGKLVIEWANNNRVYMTGPAVEVFEGTVII
jgi:diaminopimelate epimerase